MVLFWPQGPLLLVLVFLVAWLPPAALSDINDPVVAALDKVAESLDARVADGLFRAVVPKGWVVADRTGSGEFGSRSITAIIWPPERQPIVVALYITETGSSLSDRNQAIADVGAALVMAIHQGN